MKKNSGKYKKILAVDDEPKNIFACSASGSERKRAPQAIFQRKREKSDGKKIQNFSR